MKTDLNGDPLHMYHFEGNYVPSISLPWFVVHSEDGVIAACADEETADALCDALNSMEGGGE